MEPQQLKKRYEHLYSKRETWHSLWEEIARYTLPSDIGFTADPAVGEDRARYVWDSTAIDACSHLAASMHGSLTPPSATWFRLGLVGFEDPGKEADKWLEDCTEIVWTYLNQSNWDAEVAEAYIELAAFGTAAVSFEEAPREDGEFTGFHFRTMHLTEPVIAENSQGEVDQVMRKFPMTAHQLRTRFPEADLGEKVEKALRQNKPDKEFDVIHAVIPRPQDEVDWERISRGRQVPKDRQPFQSKWIVCDGLKTVHEGGYYELPYLVPRWRKLTGEVYGFGPGQVARPDVRTLNEARRYGFSAWEKHIDPPFKTRGYRGILSDLNQQAAGLTYVKDMDSLRPLMENWNPNFQATFLNYDTLKDDIRRMFFWHDFQLKDSPAMTATEVQARVELMQRVLGPTLGRLTSEFLNKLIERAFGMLWRAGKLPEPPSNMPQGVEMKVRYMSPVSRAQQMDDAAAIQRWLGDLTSVAEIEPSILDGVNWDKIRDVLHDRYGAPAEVQRADAEIKEIRQTRLKAMQAQMEDEMEEGQQEAQNGNSPRAAAAPAAQR